VRVIPFVRLIGALLVTAVATVGLVPANPAWAQATISINPGNVPTTAAGFASQECSANLGGGPFPDQDVWVFVLPQPNTQGDFLSLHLKFTTPGGPVTRDIPADPNSAIVNDMGTSKAWIRTPAGWTLTDSGTTAVITGTPGMNPHFNLTSTCPVGGPSPSGSPPVTPSGAPNTGGGGTVGSSAPFWMLLAAAAIFASVGIAFMWRRRVTRG
jgi:hypothetical protein